MILVDTSVWVDHLRHGEPRLATLLDRGEVLGHAWVTGEVALGRLSQRDEIIQLLDGLPQATLATADEVMTLIERESLSGLGVGYVDAQLLAATRLTDAAALWTSDRRLRAVAEQLGCAIEPDGPAPEQS